MPEPTTQPTTRQYLRAFERLESLKNKLVKMGLLNGDASHDDVLKKVREIVPKELVTR